MENVLFPWRTLLRNDYSHDMNWYVDTQGYMYISPMQRSRKGMMPISRPAYPNGHLGRLFIYPSQNTILSGGQIGISWGSMD